MRIGETTVMPGDLVVGDREGVYFIPPHLVTAVVDNSDTIHIHDEWTRMKFDTGKYKSSEIYGSPRDPELKKEHDAFLKQRQEELRRVTAESMSAVAVIVADDLTGAADSCATFVTHGLSGTVTFDVGGVRANAPADAARGRAGGGRRGGGRGHGRPGGGGRRGDRREHGFTRAIDRDRGGAGARRGALRDGVPRARAALQEDRFHHARHVGEEVRAAMDASARARRDRRPGLSGDGPHGRTRPAAGDRRWRHRSAARRQSPRIARRASVPAHPPAGIRGVARDRVA